MGNVAFRPELLSPAGDTEALHAAVAFGADAVYLASLEFGMRTACKNFSFDQLKDAVDYCRKNGVKVYMTCNTLPRNNELGALAETLTQAHAAGVDALIIADLGALSMAKKYAPGIAIHASTQAGVVNSETAKTLYDMGASRVVLARELSLGEIADIRANIPDGLELECFVHGAMCVSFSGRCLISSYLTGRDANRGDCAQPCRWEYHLYEQSRQGQYFPVEQDDSGTYLYNSRDLCMAEHIGQLIDAGVSSLKIEGRAKTAYYTAVTANAYRHAIDDYMNCKNIGAAPWIATELDKISHREYSTGFYLGTEPGQAVHSGGYIRKYDLVAFCEQCGDGYSVITQRNKFYVGDMLDVLPPGGMSFVTEALSLCTEDGVPVESAPHPMQKLIIRADRPIPAGSYIRVKRA